MSDAIKAHLRLLAVLPVRTIYERTAPRGRFTLTTDEALHRREIIARERATGAGVREIAKRLSLPETTVRNYVYPKRRKRNGQKATD